ncbi:exported protein of unknown function [Acetoanaerobium sticklandii]|uniref:Thioester domain-containing protein n=1 Tax=Acetoanaerobium sticklandii (strain ATCC 12662 / DSM 519 / JCM 1433 / CCUG 9281 / NCIMB 10654 / HF) TaxID=499177 RepID=E3PVK1_ACESD|nr:Cys-Gln thioester bond-forming surface protein [Acetoanaerobium sticklandii]CBH20568.1 exported protein of unknown function [Acetoanaerobium sticklandii]
MRKVKKNRLLALLLMGSLLFSNYGIMAYADEIPTAQSDSGVTQDGGTQAPSQDEGTQTPSQDEGTQTPSHDEGTQTPSQDEGTQTPSQDEGTQTPPQDEGTQAPSQDGGSQAPSQDGGTQTPPQDGNPPQIIEVEPAKVEIVDYKETQNVDKNGNKIIAKEVEYSNTGTEGETITEIVPKWGDFNDEEYETKVFDLKNTKDSKEDVTAYCNDIDTNLKNNSKYSVQELPQNSKDIKTSEKLRGIVLNGYDPNTNIETYRSELLKDASKYLTQNQINNLTEEDAIAATQMAVWKLDNPNKKFVDYDWEKGFLGIKKRVEDEKVVKLAEYLSKQKESDPSKNNLKIEAKATDENTAVKLENGEVSVNYTYSILNRVNEQVQTFLEVFVNGNQLDTNAYTVVDLGNGNKSLSFKNAIEDKTKNAEIEAKIVIKGTYAVEDVYDLVPTKDNKNTQRLVSTPMLMSYNLPTLKQMFKIEYTAPKVELVDPDEPGEDEPGEDEPGEDEPGEDEPGEDEPVEDEPGEDEPGEDEPVTPGGGGGTTNPPVVEPQPEPTNPTPQPTTPVAQNDNDDDDEDIEDEATPLAAPQIIPVALPVATLASAEQTEEVIDEETPLSAPPVMETEEEIIEEEVPLDAPAPVLPKTGGFAPELLYALGASLIATGLKIRKK